MSAFLEALVYQPMENNDTFIDREHATPMDPRLEMLRVGATFD
jgi:hypothetical protein